LELKTFRKIKPQAISLSRESLVRKEYLPGRGTLPLVLKPEVGDFDLSYWINSNLNFLEGSLLQHGGILFRDFDLSQVAKFEQIARMFAPELMGYLDQHTPRTKVTDSVYTSTEYPADHTVPFHSENSKNHTWPMKIWFFCLQAAGRGGETPIADNRKVLALLDPQIRERFTRKKVMYSRNFGEGVGLSWQTAFQTSDKTVVEDYCRQYHMEFTWKDDNRLRLRHAAQAIATHPITGDAVWFNQAHLFHVSSLAPAVRESLQDLFPEDELPSNAYYGDGSKIEDSIIEEIREAYSQAAVTFPWQAHDLLMLDNMLVAHGRAPFAGTRKVVVAMAQPFSSQESPGASPSLN